MSMYGELERVLKVCFSGENCFFACLSLRSKAAKKQFSPEKRSTFSFVKLLKQALRDYEAESIMDRESNRKNRERRAMEIILCVGEAVTDVVLSCEGEEIGRMRIEPNRELLEKILPAIDELLAKQGVSPSDIDDVRVESNLPDGYSSRRVAETVASVWKSQLEAL